MIRRQWDPVKNRIQYLEHLARGGNTKEGDEDSTETLNLVAIGKEWTSCVEHETMNQN